MIEAARPALSVVLPVYNVAPHLRACLDSLFAQTRPADEIVAVDDGSTDECPAILAEYAGRHAALRIVRQENAGLSAARNTGIARALGKWLAFVDSDDFVLPQAFERLLVTAEADALDMVVCDALYHFEGREADRPIYGDLEDAGVLPGCEWLRARLRRGRLLHMVWMHLYRADFVREAGLAFVPPWIHEDVPWTTRALLRARQLRCLPEALYAYRVPNRSFTPEQQRQRLDAIIDSSVFNVRELDTIVAREAPDDELRRLIAWQLVDGGLSVFHKLRQLADPAARRERLRRLRREGFIGTLWRHADGFGPRRRLARMYLLSLVA